METLERRTKEEALKDQAMDFYRQLIERGFKPTIDGASIDFQKKRAIISTMIVYDCGCIEVSRLPVLLDDESMKWIR
jgi:hypothetical protein